MLFAGSMGCSDMVLGRFVSGTALLQAVELRVRSSVSSPQQLSVVDKMKECGHWLCVEAAVSLFCPFSPKICRLAIHVQWLCHEL